ncbi:bifunctional hydroxymethylpyrimidine kinase/phosphomethylpyrimidine kinase [Acetobacter sp. LMG 32666]|uniref:bifunctional hydroxymethylpyrimidine kinase/phosphomethylpyrimidine kinase n=1 Tax=Acetobacter sp. LMG 32666 TaxID=2959295 RepID=UPI0030C7CD46
MTRSAPSRPRVLSIAGSDSGGGAGIQADIKTITALGGYAMTAITALTAQNTQGVQAIMPVPTQFIHDQIRCVVDDIGVDAIKTGMLGGAAQTQAVAEDIARIRQHRPALHVVVDPVMVAKGGAALLAEDALACLRTTLLPLATLVTPNLPEAEKLTGRAIHTVEDMRAAALWLHQQTGAAILLKGGHLAGDNLVDVLLDQSGVSEFLGQRIPTRHTHGTGCTLASALATTLAQGFALPDAVGRSCKYVYDAILQAPELGKGAGPLWHAHPWYPAIRS